MNLEGLEMIAVLVVVVLFVKVLERFGLLAGGYDGKETGNSFCRDFLFVCFLPVNHLLLDCGLLGLCSDCEAAAVVICCCLCRPLEMFNLDFRASHLFVTGLSFHIMSSVCHSSNQSVCVLQAALI